MFDGTTQMEYNEALVWVFSYRALEPLSRDSKKEEGLLLVAFSLS